MKRDHPHELSLSLVSRYRGIALEDLDTAGLERGTLARSVHDAARSLLVRLVRYEAANAGADVVMVIRAALPEPAPNAGWSRPGHSRSELTPASATQFRTETSRRRWSCISGLSDRDRQRDFDLAVFADHRTTWFRVI